MMDTITLSFLIKEFDLGKIDQIYLNDSLILSIHVTGKGKYFLKINSDYIYSTDFKGEMPQLPPTFCQVLRKHLGGRRIRSIEQIKGERIIKFVFDDYNLYFEFFDQGNIILTKENKIVNALHFKVWKDRSIKKGLIYKYPEREFNLFKLKKEEFMAILSKSSKNISKALAVDLGLGGKWANELCLISDIDPKSDSKDEILYKNFQKLLSKEINPFIVYKNKNFLDIIPFKFISYEDYELKPAKTLSEAYDSIYTNRKIVPKSKFNKQINKTKEIIKRQTESINKLEKSAKNNQKIGETIYENYQDINDILTQLKKAREKYSWKEIKEKTKNHKVIKEIKEKQGKIIIEL